MRVDPHRWRRFWALHLRWWWGDARLLVARSVAEYFDDDCPKLAAGISYYALFSVFPLTILMVSASGAVLGGDPALRQALVDHLIAALPLAEAEGRRSLEAAVSDVATRSAAFGVFGLVGLGWSASAMMGGVRHALNQAWDVEVRRPFLRGKLVDFGMVLGFGALLTLSFGATLFLQVARRMSQHVSNAFGSLGAGATLGFEVLALAVPLTVTFATFVLLFRIVPNVRTRVAYVWPGALVAAVLFEAAKNCFALYLRHLADYDRVYGPLGAVIVFLLFVYVGANVLLLGAEVAAEWPRVVHGHYDAELEGLGLGRDAPLRRRALLAVAGLVRSEAEVPRHIEDPSARAERRRRRAQELAGRAEPQAPSARDETPGSR